MEPLISQRFLKLAGQQWFHMQWQTSSILITDSHLFHCFLNGAAQLQQDGPDGIVLTATVNQQSNAGTDSIHNTKLIKITQPVLLVHHKKDDCYVCPYKGMKRVMKKLKNALKIELLTYEDGDNLPGKPCKALTYHGLLGIEPRVANDITAWIVK